MQSRISVRVVVTSLLLAVATMPLDALPPSEVFQRVKGSVFVVKALDDKGRQVTQGSGVLLLDGRVATNCHVVQDAIRIEVGRANHFVSASSWAGNDERDACLLEAPGLDGSPAQLGTTNTLRVGERVYAVGAPQGLELSLSEGIVSQLRGGPPPLIQTTAAISPGSSGGGLFDSEAHLVGLTTAYIEGGQSLNFAAPVEWLTGLKPSEGRAGRGSARANWLRRCVALETAGEWESLARLAERWTREQPQNPDAWAALCRAWFALKRYEDAATASRKRVSIDAADAAAWIDLGASHSRLGRQAEAIECLRKALRIAPDIGMVWYNLAEAYSGVDRLVEGIDAYREALRLDASHVNAWIGLGIAYRKSDRLDDAVKAYRQAIQLDPASKLAWYNLAVAYAYAGNRTAALDAVNSLRPLDKEMAEGLFDRLVPR